MAESLRRCGFCEVRASGIWLVLPTNPDLPPFFTRACARHGLTEIMLMRDMLGNFKFRRIFLVQTFDTEFVQSRAAPMVGSKHWDERDNSTPMDPLHAQVQQILNMKKRPPTVASSILEQYKR